MADASEKTPEEVVKEFQKKQELRRNIFVGIVVVLIGVWAFNSGSSTQNSSPEPVPTQIDTSWMPIEFNSWSDDPNVAWRWFDTKEYECTDDACWGMMVRVRL